MRHPVWIRVKITEVRESVNEVDERVVPKGLLILTCRTQRSRKLELPKEYWRPFDIDARRVVRKVPSELIDTGKRPPYRGKPVPRVQPVGPGEPIPEPSESEPEPEPEPEPVKKSFFGGKKAAVNKEPPVDIPQKKAFSFGAKKAAPEPEPEPEPVKKPMFSFGGTMKVKRAPEPEPEPEPEPVQKKPMFSFGGTMKMKRTPEPEPEEEDEPEPPKPKFTLFKKAPEPEPEEDYKPETVEERIALATQEAEEIVAAAYKIAEGAAGDAAEAAAQLELAKEAFEASEGAEKKAARVDFNRAQKVAREADSVAKVTATRAINAAKNEERSIITKLSAADRKVYKATAAPKKVAPPPVRAPDPEPEPEPEPQPVKVAPKNPFAGFSFPKINLGRKAAPVKEVAQIEEEVEEEVEEDDGSLIEEIAIPVEPEEDIFARVMAEKEAA